MKHRPTMLMILDGFGIRKETYGNAIAAANTPVLDDFFSKYPFITIEASGEQVGLPAGQMGNSEVGHLNIGAGSVIYQNLLKTRPSWHRPQRLRQNMPVRHLMTAYLTV